MLILSPRPSPASPPPLLSPLWLDFNEKSPPEKRLLSRLLPKKEKPALLEGFSEATWPSGARCCVDLGLEGFEGLPLAARAAGGSG